MSALTALLDFARSPRWDEATCYRLATAVDDAYFCSSEGTNVPFGDSEATLLANRMHDALTVVRFALRSASYWPAANAMLKLMTEATALRPAEIVAAIVDGPTSGTSSHDFLQVSRTCLELAMSHPSESVASSASVSSSCAPGAVSCALPLHALLLLQRVTDIQRAKEVFGAALMPPLCAALRCPQQGFLFYRCAATCIINLFKGSKENKVNFSGIDALVAVLTTTSDFFLQMQIVEMLFRLSRAVKGLVETAPGLPQLLQASIPRLPNDATLLEAMSRLIETYNDDVAARSPEGAKVIKFDVGCVAIGGGTVGSGGSDSVSWVDTAVYFAPKFAVVMLPGRAGENATVLYSTVRSVRITKDQRLALRLNEIPAKLAGRMRVGLDVVDGSDTLFFQLTSTTLRSLKESPIHAWMTGAMASAAAATATASQQATMLPSSHATTRDDGATTGPPPATNSKKRSRSRAEQETIQAVSGGGVTAAPPQAIPTASTTLNALEPNARRDGGKRVPSVPRQPLPAASLMPSVTPAPPPSLVTGASLEVPMSEADMLDQLRTAIRGRVDRHRAECNKTIADCMAQIQAEVDKCRAENAAERDAFQADRDREFQTLRQAQHKLKETTTWEVNRLNARLVDLQATLQISFDQRSSLESDLGAQLAAIGETLAASVSHIATAAENDIAQFEREAEDRATATHNPMRVLTALKSRILGA